MISTSSRTGMVLLLNPRSGGGKVERFQLVDRCRDLGVEAVLLTERDDPGQVAERVVADGAAVLGMAGGDGSQARVAAVAGRHDIPFVVVPAGTRNHFALDLGLDPEDPAAALTAFTDGVDVRVDLGEVNGRSFVNNVSIGVYGTVVQSDRYRDAKLRTSLEMLPGMLGPDAPVQDLRFRLPSGRLATTAHVLLVSNNPYRLPAPRGAARPHLDGGMLGVLAVTPPPPIAGGSDGRPTEHLRDVPVQDWRNDEFAVDSDSSVAVGIDGEALRLDPPLRFRSRPGALLVRLPRAAVDASHGRLMPGADGWKPDWRDVIRLASAPDPSGDGADPAGSDGWRRVIDRVVRWDRTAYRTVAGMHTDGLDRPLRTVALVADHSKPWIAVSAILLASPRPADRRGAAVGLAAVAATSLVVNVPLKRWGARRRPDRSAAGVPDSRWVPMPTSTSFPSGHAASAAAFATAVGTVVPRSRAPLAAAAAVVGFSRVYTGVHYPSDVLAGALIGTAIGRTTAALASLAWSRRG